MRLSVLIGGKAGQGINKISQIISDIAANLGYYTFNYRDYPSIIRGGHNFNFLVISDKKVGSHTNEIDFILPMDEKTVSLHKNNLVKGGVILDYDKFKEFGRDLNVALASALIKLLGIDKKYLLDQIKKDLHSKSALEAAEKGYASQEPKYKLKKLDNKISILSGSQAIAQGAINSGINLYIAYPMTPATGVLTELAAKQFEHGYMVFQPENEIAVVNAALGASFGGAKTMVGTSGGGFDLMTEGLSLQGIAKVPLVVYLSQRPGPGTGVPTYTTQSDLNLALRGGHGEFPRVVIAPGDVIEAIEKINEAFYFAEKFDCLSIVLSDKHLAESEYGISGKPKLPIKFKVTRKVPGEAIVKASSYEHDKDGNTTEDPGIVKQNQEERLERYYEIKKEISKFETYKIHGKKDGKKLIVGWGSTKGAILDAIEGKDYKFLQVLYMMPMDPKIKAEMQKAKEVILVENNLTGQLGRILREKTGVKIDHKILKYDSRPFKSDELKKELEKIK